MKKSIIVFFLLFSAVTFAYIARNTSVFKIHDVTKDTNNLNANLPYVKYTFDKVFVYKGIGNDYLFWEVSWTTKDKSILHEFTIRDAFNLKFNNPVSYHGLSSKRVDMFWYTLLFFPRFYRHDVPKLVFSTDRNSFVVWLWDIQDFKNYYLEDTVYPKNRKYDDIIGNLDYIPHIKFSLN